MYRHGKQQPPPPTFLSLYDYFHLIKMPMVYSYALHDKKNIQFNADKLQLFDHAVAKDGESTIIQLTLKRNKLKNSATMKHLNNL